MKTFTVTNPKDLPAGKVNFQVLRAEIAQRAHLAVEAVEISAHGGGEVTRRWVEKTTVVEESGEEKTVRELRAVTEAIPPSFEIHLPDDAPIIDLPGILRTHAPEKSDVEAGEEKAIEDFRSQPVISDILQRLGALEKQS